MSVTGLLGVFLGGAIPWLEAVVVIPVAIVAGLEPVPVVIVALAGNLLTVWLAAFYGERLREWWRAWRRQRGTARGDGATAAPGARRRRAQRVFNRWGLPGLAVVGPIGLGTQLSAVLAVSLGVSARRSMAWVSAGTVAWCLLAAVLTTTGVSFLGVGA